MLFACRVNHYEEAERQLTNAFTVSPGQAVKLPPAELDPDDRTLAARFVRLVEDTDPLNIAGLSQLIGRQQQLVSDEAKGLLDAKDFMRVS